MTEKDTESEWSTQEARDAHVLWLDSLSDDELADIAEQALERESRRSAEPFRQVQGLALQSLRAVISDCLSESPPQHGDSGVSKDEKSYAEQPRFG